jgi:peptidoglycan/xylan/chitin deacetylase (PgdA/CDA1 family)
VPTVTVDGVPIAAARAATVRAALIAAGLEIPTGQILAVVTRRPLGSDGHRGRVLVNDTAATLATRLSASDQVTTVAGRDQVEATRPTEVALPAPNPSNLYVGGIPGRAIERVGVRSGEVASTRTLAEPQPGHLVSPGAVALTIDDGPDPTYTPQVLALLADAHVHATFCLIGKNAARYPQLVRDIVAGGHTLCDHTWDHDEQLRSRPAGEIALDISRGADAIRQAAGVTPLLFRAPGGNWSPALEAQARAQHMTPLKWTVDPRDWSRPGERAILATVYAELRPGGVILCHDGGGDRSQTVAALKVLMTRLPAMGYHFVIPPTA